MRNATCFFLALAFCGDSAMADTGWTPTADQIRDALQREVNARIERLDALAERCEHVGETESPFDAFACLMTGVGQINSETVSIQINSILLDECVRSRQNIAFCRYQVDSTTTGSGLMAQVSQFMNTLGGLGGWAYASYEPSSAGWVFHKSYEWCDWGGSSINCQVQE